MNPAAVFVLDRATRAFVNNNDRENVCPMCLLARASWLMTFCTLTTPRARRAHGASLFPIRAQLEATERKEKDAAGKAVTKACLAVSLRVSTARCAL